MEKLQAIRAQSGPSNTFGLSDEVIQSFLSKSSDLKECIDTAFEVFQKLDANSTYKQPEKDLIVHTGDGWCLFYRRSFRAPYIPLAGKGSWVVTLYGAVINDSSSYGMLSLGHSPSEVLTAMNQPSVVMANIITPSLSQIKFQKCIREEIGRKREGGCPYAEFLMMNSGSEANSVIDRIIDVAIGHRVSDSLSDTQFLKPRVSDKHEHHPDALSVSRSTSVDSSSDMAPKTSPLSSNPREKAMVVSLRGSFHGRTYKPAIWTDSTRDIYNKNKCESIYSIQEEISILVDPNDCEGLQKIFEETKMSGNFISLMVIEAVMGEGNPGQAITREFYKLARQLTIDHGGFLAVDSVQAGFRATGNLSIVDYPGYTNLPEPDFESFSKALNAGQYPLSVVALSERAAKWHRPGIYGNTMTGNPRACEVAVAVMKSITHDLRVNIMDIGKYAIDKFKQLKNQFPRYIHDVTGSGLLYAVHLNQQYFHVVNEDEHSDDIIPCAETWMRMNGIGVIHGGENALRFTPRFAVTKEEIDLQAQVLRDYLCEHGPIVETIQ